jgi:hypothetical protein
MVVSTLRSLWCSLIEVSRQADPLRPNGGDHPVIGSLPEHLLQLGPTRGFQGLMVVAALASWAAGPAPAVADSAPEPVTIRPGGVVRWPGSEITSCRMGGADWRPLDGACWYPVDLLVEPGQLDLERVRDGRIERTAVEVGQYPYPVQRLQVAPEMANPPAEAADRIRRERQQVGAIWTLGSPPVFELPLSPPIDPLPTPRSFGSLRVFNGEPRSPHGGIDLSAEIGTPVRAAASGTVVIAARHYFAGNSVFIDHGDDLVTMYFHLDEILVAEGDRVGPETEIGTVGATGRVTGPHLHFGIRWHGARIDPTVLLSAPVGTSLPTP